MQQAARDALIAFMAATTATPRLKPPRPLSQGGEARLTRFLA
jgi:hypothetical protein